MLSKQSLMFWVEVLGHSHENITRNLKDLELSSFATGLLFDAVYLFSRW